MYMYAYTANKKPTMEMDIVFISAVHSRCLSLPEIAIAVAGAVAVACSCMPAPALARDANGAQKGRHNGCHQRQQRHRHLEK